MHKLKTIKYIATAPCIENWCCAYFLQFTFFFFNILQITDFVAGHPELGSGARAFQQAIERTRNNINWMNSNYMPIKSWLNRIQG